jgi:hypothetical protein
VEGLVYLENITKPADYHDQPVHIANDGDKQCAVLLPPEVNPAQYDINVSDFSRGRLEQYVYHLIDDPNKIDTLPPVSPDFARNYFVYTFNDGTQLFLGLAQNGRGDKKIAVFQRKNIQVPGDNENICTNKWMVVDWVTLDQIPELPIRLAQKIKLPIAELQPFIETDVSSNMVMVSLIAAEQERKFTDEVLSQSAQMIGNKFFSVFFSERFRKEECDWLVQATGIDLRKLPVNSQLCLIDLYFSGIEKLKITLQQFVDKREIQSIFIQQIHDHPETAKILRNLLTLSPDGLSAEKGEFGPRDRIIETRGQILGILSEIGADPELKPRIEELESIIFPPGTDLETMLQQQTIWNLTTKHGADTFSNSVVPHTILGDKGYLWSDIARVFEINIQQLDTSGGSNSIQTTIVGAILNSCRSLESLLTGDASDVKICQQRFIQALRTEPRLLLAIENMLEWDTGSFSSEGAKSSQVLARRTQESLARLLYELKNNPNNQDQIQQFNYLWEKHQLLKKSEEI